APRRRCAVAHRGPAVPAHAGPGPAPGVRRGVPGDRPSRSAGRGAHRRGPRDMDRTRPTETLVKTLFPPYAHPSPELALDADTWIIQGRPGDAGSAHQVMGRVDMDWGGRSLADVLADVDAWREDGVQGLFLDRAPAGASGVGPVALTVRLPPRGGLPRGGLHP